MRLFMFLFLLPITTIIGLSLIFPDGTGVFLGLGVTLLYYTLTVVRASDWT